MAILQAKARRPSALDGEGVAERHKVESCAIEADGALILATTSKGTVEVWEAATGDLRAALRVRHPFCISLDGTFIIDSALKIWDLETGGILDELTGAARSLESPGEIRALAVSRDNSLVMSWADAAFGVWDTDIAL